ncbi:MAG: SHOCT domain-containing protein, partial [Rhodanobacteraceae bacterium]
MTTAFVVIAALMVTVALALLLKPLLGHKGTNARSEPARRLRALDEALAAGVIDSNEYRAKRDVLAHA